MAEKRDWNVGLNAKGLEGSVSEEQARRMCLSQGQTSMFIIEAHHGPYVTNEDGSIKMSLIIDQAELVPAEQEERTRRFKRALYLARPDQFGQAAFDGATAGEPTIEDTAAGIDAATEEVADSVTHAEADALAAEVLGDPDEPEADAGEPWPGDPEYVAPDNSNVVQASFTG